MFIVSSILQIPYGNTAAIAAITAPATEATFEHSFCGRYFSITSSGTAGATVCSKCELIIHLFTQNWNLCWNEVEYHMCGIKDRGWYCFLLMFLLKGSCYSRRLLFWYLKSQSWGNNKNLTKVRLNKTEKAFSLQGSTQIATGYNDFLTRIWWEFDKKFPNKKREA